MSAAATGTVTRVSLDPDLTIITAAETRARLLAALESAAELELDAGPVAEMDTAGLQVLLLIAREGRAAGRPVRLVGESSAVNAVLTLAHIGPDLLPLGTTADPEVKS